MPDRSGDVFSPRLLHAGCDSMGVSQTVDVGGSQLPEDVLKTLVGLIIAGTVHFEILEQKQQLFNVGDGETIVDAVKGMRQDVEDIGFQEIVHQFVNVLAGLLDVPVLGFVDIQCQDVNLATERRTIIQAVRSCETKH